MELATVHATTDAWTVLATLASVVAALSALAALVVAGRTLADARTARREAAEQQEALLAAQERLAHAAEDAHRVELEAAQAAQAAHEENRRLAEDAGRHRELLARLEAVDTVAGLIKELADVARHECVTPPPTFGEIQKFELSALPTLLLRLQTALGTCRSLGCPDLDRAEELSRHSYRPRIPPVDVIGLAVGALGELEALIRNDSHLHDVGP